MFPGESVRVSVCSCISDERKGHDMHTTNNIMQILNNIMLYNYFQRNATFYKHWLLSIMIEQLSIYLGLT